MQKEFKIGDEVYHRSDQHQELGIVTGVTERPGHYIYLVTFGGARESGHYGMELTPEKTIY